MRSLVRDRQSVWNRILRMERKLRRPHTIHNRLRRVGHFFGKGVGQEDGGFGNPKIRRPPFRFIYVAQERPVLVGGEVCVETCAKSRIHVNDPFVRLIPVIRSRC